MMSAWRDQVLLAALAQESGTTPRASRRFRPGSQDLDRCSRPSPIGDHRPHDSSLQGNGFEILVPRQIGSGFNASVGLRSIERRRRGIIRAVVGLGKPIELFRGAQGAPLTAEMKAPTLLAV